MGEGKGIGTAGEGRWVRSQSVGGKGGKRYSSDSAHSAGSNFPLQLK